MIYTSFNLIPLFNMQNEASFFNNIKQKMFSVTCAVEK